MGVGGVNLGLTIHPLGYQPADVQSQSRALLEVVQLVESLKEVLLILDGYAASRGGYRAG